MDFHAGQIKVFLTIQKERHQRKHLRFPLDCQIIPHVVLRWKTTVLLVEKSFFFGGSKGPHLLWVTRWAIVVHLWGISKIKVHSKGEAFPSKVRNSCFKPKVLKLPGDRGGLVHKLISGWRKSRFSWVSSVYSVMRPVSRKPPYNQRLNSSRTPSLWISTKNQWRRSEILV